VVAFVSPAFKDGGSIGSFDTLLPFSSLGAGAFTGPPHNVINGDSVSLLVAFNTFDWRAIHHFQFPLWNDLTLLGLPAFFNFQSAVLSLPDLVSYLAPLSVAYLVAVAMKLLIAGTGAYVLCRVLGLRPLASTLGGVIFMLSGPFAGWLTWSLSDVIGWLGWLAAFMILAYRWKGKRRYVVLLAISVAFCIYGGFPEAYLYATCALVVLFGVFILLALLARRRISLSGTARVATGILAGGVLAAPLWLPGLKVISMGHRLTLTSFNGLPARALSLLVAQGYYGLPINGSTWFFNGTNYYETAAYVGVIALVLAGAAVLRWWRHPMVIALAATVVVAMVISYQTTSFHVVADLLRHTPLDSIPIGRMRSVIGLPLGVLSALGLETLLRCRGERRMVATYWGVSVAIAAFVAILWYGTLRDSLPSALHQLRLDSMLWPTGLVAACVLAGGLFILGLRPASRSYARAMTGAGAAVLVGAEAAFLLFAGVGIQTYSTRFYPTTSAISQLKAVVGSGLVGFDTGIPEQVQVFAPVGIYPNGNFAYEIAQYAAHDPLIPQRYFKSWNSGANLGKGGLGIFEADINSATLARRYGINWILQVPGTRLPPPPGTRYVGSFAGERLFAVPGAARFSVLTKGGSKPSSSVTSVQHTANNSWTFTVDTKAPGTLIMRVTNTPGWHASINGRSLQLSSYQSVMLAARVPVGRYTVHLWYLPERLEIATWLALVVLAMLLAWAGWPLVRREQRRGPEQLDLGASFAPGLGTAELASRKQRGARLHRKEHREHSGSGKPLGVGTRSDVGVREASTEAGSATVGPGPTTEPDPTG